MRVVAIIAAHNEARVIDACLRHLIAHGVEVYLIDNDSTDATVEIASAWRGHGVITIERFPRGGCYSWGPLLERKEQIALDVHADWIMHVDADEIRLPPRGMPTLADALADVAALGYNAVNFLEFTFVPTREAPDHDHADFQRTMRAYYAFVPPLFPNRLNAWRKQLGRVELARSGGHQVRFPDLRMYPQSFPMRHYLCLSMRHAVTKYIERTYDPGEVDRGWHRARARLRRDDLTLPSQVELRTYVNDESLDASSPRSEHVLFTGATRAIHEVPA